MKRARSVAALAIAQPVGNEGAEVDLAQLGFDGPGFEKMHFDEFAELVGDAVLIALDDRGVRDRQSQRPAKQRHHGIPVGQPADGCGFRERCDEAEDGMQVQQRLRRDEQRQRAGQHQRRERLYASQFGRTRSVAGRIGGERGRHGFIGGASQQRRTLIAESEHPRCARTSGLMVRVGASAPPRQQQMYWSARQKEGPHERAFEGWY